MDHCRKIWFITPAGYVVRFLGILAMGAGILAALVML